MLRRLLASLAIGIAGLAMPQKRTWPWCHGKRLKPQTWYYVRDPSTNAIELTAAERKRVRHPDLKLSVDIS